MSIKDKISSLSFKKIILIFAKIITGFFAFSILLVILYRFVPIPYTPFMFWKSAASLFSKQKIGIEKKWVPIEGISKSVQRAVIRAEDAKFYDHNGFDFEAIEKAMKYNRTHKKQKGASTISQQTAKNVFLWPSRNWVRKGLEVYFTVLIEIFWSKERILEAYLNVIELGPGIYGVEAASLKYFKKKAKNLTSAQSALIAAVLPNPIKFKIDRPSAYILRRQRKIMGSTASIALSPTPTPEVKVEQNSASSDQEFFDIKFDEDDESGPDDLSDPANE